MCVCVIEKERERGEKEHLPLRQSVTHFLLPCDWPEELAAGQSQTVINKQGVRVCLQCNEAEDERKVA